MITDDMKLTSRADADVWADNLGLTNESSRKRVADWIWENKPHPDSTYSEHPLSRLDTEDFWDISEPVA